MNPDGRPDWVVLGVPTPDGRVAVVASKELNEAELRHELDGYDEDFTGWYARVRPRHQRFEMTVEMRTYTVVTADTYEQALRSLFESWSPEPNAAAALEPAQRSIMQ